MRLAEVFTRNSTLVMRVTDVWHARYWCFVTPGIDVTPVLVFVALAINELSIYIIYILYGHYVVYCHMDITTLRSTLLTYPRTGRVLSCCSSRVPERTT